MNERGRDQVQLTDKERLIGEVKAKLSELLSQDGREITLADLGPSLHVEYSLDLPHSIVGIEIGLYKKDVDAKLIVNQKTNKAGPFGRLIAIVEILEGDKESSSVNFIFNQGVPSIQYKESEPNKRFFSRQVSVEELASFLQLLKQPLYLIDSPQQDYRAGIWGEKGDISNDIKIAVDIPNH